MIVYFLVMNSKKSDSKHPIPHNNEKRLLYAKQTFVSKRVWKPETIFILYVASVTLRELESRTLHVLLEGLMSCIVF